jgi:hypothetical protein
LALSPSRKRRRSLCALSRLAYTPPLLPPKSAVGLGRIVIESGGGILLQGTAFPALKIFQGRIFMRRTKIWRIVADM